MKNVNSKKARRPNLRSASLASGGEKTLGGAYSRQDLLLLAGIDRFACRDFYAYRVPLLPDSEGRNVAPLLR